MYQRKDKKFNWDRFFKTLFIMIVLVVGGIYIMINLILINAKNEFDLFFNGFDVESSLIDEAHINYTFLDQRAQQFEDLIGKYHIPYNMTGEGWDYYPPVAVCWSWSNSNWKFWNNTQLLESFDPQDVNSPYTKENMTYCGDRAHTALYEGVYCAGEAFRYAWAKRNNDVGNMTAAKDRILKIIKAYKLLNEVSDNSAFVRYAVPDTKEAKEKFPGHWETEDHDVVEYKGFKWSLSRHLSRDVSIGIMFGLAMSYMLVDDDDVRDIAGKVIDNAVSYWYDCNWRIVDTDGTQHTSADFMGSRPMMEGGTILTFLQAAKMVKPKKWGPIYNHYLYDRGLLYTMGRSMRIGVDLVSKIFSGYYGCNFLFNCAPTLILLEEDPAVKEIFIRNWLNVLHDFTKFHRNANFDVVWLLCHSNFNTDDKYDKIPKITLEDYDLEIWKDAKHFKKPTDKDYIKEFSASDIKDCLMRYAVRRYPNRDYYWATAPGTFPNKHQNKINLSGYIVPYPEYDLWEPDTYMAELITSILGGVEGLEGGEYEDAGILDNSLPVDMRNTEDIMWQRNPFTVDTTERLTSNPGSYQAPMGPEYLSVYWMAKYLDILN